MQLVALNRGELSGALEAESAVEAKGAVEAECRGGRVPWRQSAVEAKRVPWRLKVPAGAKGGQVSSIWVEGCGGATEGWINDKGRSTGSPG